MDKILSFPAVYFRIPPKASGRRCEYALATMIGPAQCSRSDCAILIRAVRKALRDKAA